MNSKQVFDIRPSKGITKAQSDEHLRIPSQKGREFAEKKGGHYDTSRDHLNFEVIRGGRIAPLDKNKSIPQRIEENLAARGIADPNDGTRKREYRTVANIIFGGSTETMWRLAFGKQVVNFENKRVDHSRNYREREIEEWAKDIYRWVSKQWGEENIAAFVVHLDESNPHIHCTLLPILDGKFAYKKIFAGKDKFEYSARMKELHSSLAEVNKRWGLNRGTPIAETGAKHRSTEQYRRELTDECTRLEEEIHRKNIALKGLNTMIQNLLDSIEEKEHYLVQLTELLENKSDDKKLYEEQQKVIRQIAELKEQLKDKQEKYDNVVQSISQAEERLKTIEQRSNETIEHFLNAAQEEIDFSHSLLRSALLEDMIEGIKELLPQLEDHDRELVEGSLVGDLTDHGEEIAHEGVALFMNVLGDATTFARGSSGGDSSNEDWGRKKDEDDASWARRCAHMARHFVRAKKKVVPEHYRGFRR